MPRLGLAWAGSTLLALLCMGKKQEHYLVLLLPPMALLVGFWIDAGMPPLAAQWRATASRVGAGLVAAVLLAQGAWAFGWPDRQALEVREVGRSLLARRDLPQAYFVGVRELDECMVDFYSRRVIPNLGSDIRVLDEKLARGEDLLVITKAPCCEDADPLHPRLVPLGPGRQTGPLRLWRAYAGR